MGLQGLPVAEKRANLAARPRDVIRALNLSRWPAVETDRRGVSHAPPRAEPTQDDAEAAVRTLIEWAGDDPDREGLLETPQRVARAYRRAVLRL